MRKAAIDGVEEARSGDVLAVAPAKVEELEEVDGSGEEEPEVLVDPDEDTLNRVLGENEYRDRNLDLLATLGMVNARFQPKPDKKKKKRALAVAAAKKKRVILDGPPPRRTSRGNIVKRNLSDRVLASVCGRCGTAGHSVKECARPPRQRRRRYGALEGEKEESWELGMPDSMDGWD